MARFIKDSDYPTLLRNEIRTILLEEYDEQKLLRAEDMAIAQLRNYLHGRYDVELIFTAHEEEENLPDERNAHVIMCVMDCAIYHLYTSLAPDKIPSHRSDRYQDVISWMKDVGRGTITPDLPKIADSDGEGDIGFKITSEYKNEDNRW